MTKDIKIGDITPIIPNDLFKVINNIGGLVYAM